MPNLQSEQAKKRILIGLENGLTVEQACRTADRSVKSFEYYKKSDPDFSAAVSTIRESHRRAGAPPEPVDFPTFRKRYLGRDTFWHQHQWIDLLDGKAPRDLHPAQRYEPAEQHLLLINCPPDHSKTTTITVDWVVYRMCHDPNVRVRLISKTATFAQTFLYEIKTILTHPKYRELQLDYGPVGGWKGSADSWTATQIYLGGDVRDSGEKDPTVAVAGIGGQIYGSRADLIIVDDAVVLSNAMEFDKQIRWLQQEAMSRLTGQGVLLVVGTRVAPVDLYSELRNPERYPEGETPWTYFAQPALMEGADDPEKWLTLWPRTNTPCGCRGICKGSTEPGPDGLFPKYDGAHLAAKRRTQLTDTWPLVYQQQDVADDAVFKAALVARAVNGQRMAGPLKAGAVGHPEQGGLGHYLIGSMDPAMVGNTAAIVYSVDRATGKRYVLDIHDQPAMTPAAIKDLIKKWTEKYHLNEWRIEKNAFQQYLTQDADLRDWLAGRGCVLKEHHTGTGKWDAEFGVASVAPLFGSMDENTGRTITDPLIELPATKRHEAAKRLVEQLVSWTPEAARKQRGPKTDIVMALWFAEIRAREVISGGKQRAYYVENKYVTPLGKRARAVVNLDELYLRNQRQVVRL